MNKGMQKTALEIGRYGCYFLSIVEAAEKKTGKSFPILPTFLDMKKRGYIGEDSYVLAPDRIMSELTGKAYAVRHESRSYKAKDGEIEILRYEWRRKGETSAHFVLGDGSGRVAFDPLDGANTVKNGVIESKRIFTPLRNA
ncbi:MAG: DUF261 family protein [Treponema sp.]